MQRRKPLTNKKALQRRTPLKSKQSLQRKTALRAQAAISHSTFRTRCVPLRTRPPQPIPAEVLSEVRRRSRGFCESCGRKIDKLREPHHVIFRSRSGKHVPENLMDLCWWCHYGPHRPDVDNEARYRFERQMAAKYGLSLEAWKQVATGQGRQTYGSAG